MSLPPTIFADAESEPEVCIRVEGKGSFQNSPALKEFSQRMIEAGRRDFIIDLQNCSTMDSTFMGTLAGIAMRIRDAGGGNLWVVNRNERNAELLAGLGLDALFSEKPIPVQLNGDKGRALIQNAGRAAIRQTMQDAHEACVAANPANASKFKDVIEHLKASAAEDAAS